MNAKLCKRLRAEARAATIGAPAVRYVGVSGRFPRTTRLDPTCARALYHTLKSRAASPMTFERYVEDKRRSDDLARLTARQMRRRRAARRRA